MLLSPEGIVASNSRFIRIGHIDRNSFRLLPRMENRTGKARSSQKRLVPLAGLNARALQAALRFSLAKTELCHMVTSATERTRSSTG